MRDHPQLRIYELRGLRTTLIWCRDRKNTWETELADKTPPETLARVELDLSIPEKAAVRCYDPWSNRWENLKAENGKVTLPDFKRSMVLRIERP
jgi:hypothetical protein